MHTAGFAVLAGVFLSSALATFGPLVEPAAKRQKTEPRLAGWLSKGARQEEVHKGVVCAMAASNLPLSKLGKNAPLRKSFEKCILVGCVGWSRQLAWDMAEEDVD